MRRYRNIGRNDLLPVNSRTNLRSGFSLPGLSIKAMLVAPLFGKLQRQKIIRRKNGIDA
jgi:hypothetical protein